jgi:hypothetical protein
MKIAVLADTHDYLPDKLIQAFSNVDEIWHLGDVIKPSILDLLYEAQKPLHVVRGNCDSCKDWPISLTLKREGVRFYLTHIPPDDAPLQIDVVLHGHLHVPRDEMIDNVRFLNPGSVREPRGDYSKSWGLLEIRDAKVNWMLQIV